MADDASFWNKIAAKYAASPVKDEAAYAETLERARAYLSREATVLELGCGTGTTALKLAPHVTHITATDIAGEMINIARGKAGDIENVTFAQDDTSCHGIADASLEAVLAFSLLHLVRDLPAALARVNAVLKPGGMFISKTPCLAQQTRLWSLPIALMRVIGKAPFVNLLTFPALDRAIQSAGFEIIETDVLPPPVARFAVARKI